MPVAMMQTMEGVTTEMYDAVNAKVNEGGPPDGLIVHTAGVVDGNMRVVDVWESQEHHDRFRDELLLPAIREVAGEEAATGPPQQEWWDLHDMIKP